MEAKNLKPPVGTVYLVWLAGLACTLVGGAVMSFALGWVASSIGGTSAGLVLTAIVLPRVLLLLLGGALADRYGARRIMLIGDAVMVVVTAAATLLSDTVGAELWLLVLIALFVGAVDAFYIPASGSMPRRLVPAQAVPRALAMRQVIVNIVGLVGAPLGGVLVAFGGFPFASGFNLLTFIFMFIVLAWLVHVPASEEATASRGRVSKDVADGLKIAITNPLLRSALLLVAGAAAFLLPIMILMVPLFARSQGWTSSSTGLVVGVFGGMSAVVALTVVMRGVSSRIGAASAVGLLVAGVGVAILFGAGHVAWGTIGSAVAGFGAGIFSAHIGPLILQATPQAYLSRLQSVNVLAQSLPLLISNNVLGIASDRAGAQQVGLVCAGLIVAVGVYGLLNRTCREAVSGGQPG